MLLKISFDEMLFLKLNFLNFFTLIISIFGSIVTLFFLVKVSDKLRIEVSKDKFVLTVSIEQILSDF